MHKHSFFIRSVQTCLSHANGCSIYVPPRTAISNFIIAIFTAYYDLDYTSIRYHHPSSYPTTRPNKCQTFRNISKSRICPLPKIAAANSGQSRSWVVRYSRHLPRRREHKSFAICAPDAPSMRIVQDPSRGNAVVAAAAQKNCRHAASAG